MAELRSSPRLVLLCAFSLLVLQCRSAFSAPAITGTVAAQPVNDNSTVSPFAGVTITDSNSPPQTEHVNISLNQSQNGAFTAASLSASGFSGAGPYTFSGTAATATTAIRKLVFAPTSHQVQPGSTVTTIFTIVATNGLAGVTNSNTTVIATAINNPPTIVGTVANQQVNDNATISPFSGVTISDPDISTEPASITVTLDAAANGRFTAPSTTGWTVNVFAGTYTFGGTRSQVEVGLQGLVFSPTAHQVVPGSTVTTAFTLSLTDGANPASVDNTTTVTATAINNPPTIVGTVANQPVNDNATISPFSGVTISDPDVSTEPASITVTLNAAANGQFTAFSTTGWTVNVSAGVYSFGGARSQVEAGLQGLVFSPTAHQVVPGATVTTTFTLSLSDGANSALDNTTTVIATAINNPPTIQGTVANQRINDNAAIPPFSGVTIADVDFGASETITVTLDSSAKGGFTTASLSASGFSAAGPYTFSGGPTAATSAIRQLVFVPAGPPAPGATSETTTFTIRASDGAASVTNSATTVVVFFPTLQIQGQAGFVKLQWPTNFTGYSVATSATLANSNNWATVTNTPVTNGATYLLTVPATNASGFFRLHSP